MKTPKSITINMITNINYCNLCHCMYVSRACELFNAETHLVFNSMFFLLHFGQGELQVIYVFLQLGALVFQLPLLGSELSIHILFFFQSFGEFFGFGLQQNLVFNQPLASFLCICQTLAFLFNKKRYLQL